MAQTRVRCDRCGRVRVLRLMVMRSIDNQLRLVCRTRSGCRHAKKTARQGDS